MDSVSRYSEQSIKSYPKYQPHFYLEPSDYDEGYKDGRAEAIEQFREYLKTVIPCEMPQDIWDMGVDNTCDRMLKEKK